MRSCSIISTLLLSLWIGAAPALCATIADPTAKKALRRLPKAEVQRLARIVAIGGTPVPESWHILSHDPKSETGVREWIVADGEISEAREVSEYASYLTEEDVIGSRAVKTDTDRVFHIANRYALENDLLVASMNYTLEKNGLGDAVWRVDCMDESAVVVGSLEISAATGEVLERVGFPIEPTMTAPRQTKLRSGTLKLNTDAEQVVGDEAFEDEEEEVDEPVVAVSRGGASRESARSASAKKSSRKEGSRSARKARRSGPDDVARTVTRPVRRVLRRVLPF